MSRKSSATTSKKEKKPKIISLPKAIKMYIHYLTKFADNGISTDTVHLDVKRSEMFNNYSSVISATHVTKLYHLTDVPTELTRSIPFLLKDKLPRGVQLDIITQVIDAPIDWTTPYMKRLKSAWNKEIKANRPKLSKEKLNDSDSYKKSRQSGSALDSWNLLSKKTAEGYRTCDVETLLILRYPKSMPLKEQINGEIIWITTAKSKGLGIVPIQKDVKTMLYELSPTCVQGTNPVKNFSTWLDSNVAFSESYLPGKLDGREIFLGRDIFTNMFVYSDLLQTGGGALNMMILAGTGAGKSFYIKFLTEIFLARKVNVIVWDKDGEYEALAEYFNYPVISLGKNGGHYFNTIPIMETDLDGYKTSQKDTMAVFGILCDPVNGMLPNENFIIQMAYGDLLASSGVKENDLSTWKNANGLDYKDLYNQVMRMSSITEDIRDTYNDLCRKLSEFFDPVGVSNNLFTNPINIKDFLHIKSGGQPLMLGINMQVTSSSQASSASLVVDRIKSLTMSSITQRLVSYNKSLGELTAVVIEEFQRHTTNKAFVEEVHSAVTGGRKQNLIPIIILNSLGTMVNGDNPKLKDIVENINTMIVGAVKEEVREHLSRFADMKYCDDALAKIHMASEVKDSDLDRWRNSFLVKIKTKKRTEFAVVKAHIPPYLRETLFKTRDDSKYGRKEEITS